MSTKSDENLVLDVVRGIRPWEDLRRVGLAISFIEGGCNCDGRGTVVATPSIGDLARGIDRHLSNPASDLERWSAVMLAASAVIDFSQIIAREDGERLISALWDASGRQEVDHQVRTLARSLAV